MDVDAACENFNSKIFGLCVKEYSRKYDLKV